MRPDLLEQGPIRKRALAWPAMGWYEWKELDWVDPANNIGTAEGGDMQKLNGIFDNRETMQREAGQMANWRVNGLRQCATVQCRRACRWNTRYSKNLGPSTRVRLAERRWLTNEALTRECAPPVVPSLPSLTIAQRFAGRSGYL